MKKLLVLFLCVLAVFAIVSCKNEPEVYKVTFNTQGGSEIAEASVKEGEKVAAPEDPTKVDYNFVGWFTEEACENEYDFATPVKAAITLYAKWKEQAPAPTTIYQLNSTKADTRFQFKWDAVASSGGKVFTLKYKSSKALGTFTSRDPSGEKYLDGKDLADYTEPAKDGWTLFTCTIPEGEHAGFGLALFEAEGVTAEIGDLVYIGDIYIGETELTLAQENSWAGNGAAIKTVSGYKLTATKGTDGADDYKYDQDKFTLYWNPNTPAYQGDTFSITFKAVRKDEMTKGRDFTYSIRDAGKWFSEKDKTYWTTFSEPDCDGWITATYTFPAISEAAEPAKIGSYPATFRVDFRDTKIAAPTEENPRIADVLYIRDMTITHEGVTEPLVLDAAKSTTKYAKPTIEEF